MPQDRQPGHQITVGVDYSVSSAPPVRYNLRTILDPPRVHRITHKLVWESAGREDFPQYDSNMMAWTKLDSLHDRFTNRRESRTILFCRTGRGFFTCFLKLPLCLERSVPQYIDPASVRS
jgi:hypothetical protein